MQPPSPDTRPLDTARHARRMGRASWCAAACLGVLAARAFAMQLPAARRRAAAHLAAATAPARESLEARRGRILDANGVVLAEDRETTDLYIVPSRVARAHLAALLARVPSAARTVALRADAAPLLPDAAAAQWVRVARDLDDGALAALRAAHLLPAAGVALRPRYVRRYPLGARAAHVVGWVGAVGYQDLTLNAPLRAGERVGRAGIEQQFDRELRGVAGVRTTFDPIGAAGRARAADAPPRAGRDVTLTIDAALTRAIDAAFDARGIATGAAVVLEVESGLVRALYSRGAVDPNVFSARLSAQAYDALYTDEREPLVDRAARAPHRPGRAIAPFVLLAAHARGALPAAAPRCTGEHRVGRRVWRCARAHGAVRDAADALARGCNEYLFALAARDPRVIGVGEEAFGFGRWTTIGLPHEEPGSVRSADSFATDLRSAPGAHAVGFGEVLGQGETFVTPVQLASAYATLAHPGGTLVRPYIRADAATGGDRLLSDGLQALRRPESFAFVRGALRAVVAAPASAAHEADVPGLEVAGITGVGAVSHDRCEATDGPAALGACRDHGWFAGFAPASAPRVAVVVLTEHSGNATPAAQIAAEALRASLRELAATAQPSHATAPRP